MTSAFRKLQIVIVHHLSHSNFFERKDPRNGKWGRMLSFLLLIEPFDSYKKHHTQDHHFGKHMTELDPTVEFLFRKVGLAPGMSIGQAKRQLFSSFLQPQFYARTFMQRVREQKWASVGYRWALVAWWLALTTFFVGSGHAPLLAFMVMIPLFILYPISSALRLAVEHSFRSNHFLRSMGIAGALVALIAATLALVVLPAILALLGPRVTPSPRSGCSAPPTGTRDLPSQASGTGCRDP